MEFSHFEILNQFSGFYPQEDPLGVSRTLKTNYIAYIDNFQTKRSILDLTVSLVRATPRSKTLSQGVTPQG